MGWGNRLYEKYKIKTIIKILGGNNMTATYNYLGYGVTDENGIAKLDHDANGDSISHSYTGTGAGKIDVVASLDSPSSISDSSLVSETYELEDCYWVEKSSTISGMYTNSGGTLTLENGVFTLTKGSGSSYFYLNIPKTSLPIADFVDKDLIVKADVTTLTGTQLRCTLFYNTESWVSVVQDITTTGTINLSNHIPSDATQVRIRFDIFGDTDSQAVLEEFRLLLG